MNQFLLSLFLCFSLSLFSQKNVADPEDVSFAEQMKTAYEDEVVAALDSKIMVSFDLDEKRNKVIVKVVKEEALIGLSPSLNYGIAEFYDDYSEVDKIEIFNKKGKSLSLTRKDEIYSQSGIFFSDAKICYFSVPFPTIGTRRRVRITKTYSDIRYFVSEYLSTNYPLKSRTITFSVPEWLKLDMKTMNFEETATNTKTWVEKDNKNHSFSLQDVPPQSDDAYSKGPTHIYPHILVLYQGYTYKGKQETGLATSKDLYKWYRHLTTDMSNKPAVVAQMAKELTAEASSDTEKIKAVYYWVQENIRYIAFEDGIAGFQPDDCQEVFNKKYGDCKGMANLTKEMLKSIGFDARLTWIGTRRLAYDYSTPSLGVDNHMICAVKLGEEFVFLDATEEFNELGFYAERIQGRPVMIEAGDDFILSKIPESTHTSNTQRLTRDLELQEDKITGKCKISFEGDSKAYFLYQINNMKQDRREDALKAYLDEKDKSCKVENVVTSDFTERDETMFIDFDFSWEKAVTTFGDEVYLDLDFDKELKGYTFDERETDYLFDYKTHRITEVSLTLPSTYTISVLPENFERTHEDFSFKITYKKEGDKIIYRKEIAIPYSEIKKADFETWNSYIKDLNKQYKSPIVLKKSM